MPRSRKRFRPRRRRPKIKRDPLALDSIFDRVVEAAYRVQLPPILYHYTSWSGAQGILSSQTFWAAAHDCTNDEAELLSADSTTIEVARELRRRATGAAARVLDLFVEGYPGLHITKMITVCLACFSVARDDKGQWLKYGDEGRGICLGIRVPDETRPSGPPSALIKVDYSESSWRSTLVKHLEEICSVLDRSDPLPRDYELGLLAIYRIAAFHSIMAKRPEWMSEQEVRYVTPVARDSGIALRERESAGRTVRYLPVRVGEEGKRIALAEVIIGPNQNLTDARKRLQELLADCGYEVGDIEYPDIAFSMDSATTVVRPDANLTGHGEHS